MNWYSESSDDQLMGNWCNKLIAVFSTLRLNKEIKDLLVTEKEKNTTAEQK